MKTRLNIISITILSLLLTITLLPVSIHADETAEPNKPDVSVYATKEQLMDDTFRLDEYGTANNIGKIVFGKKKNADNTYSPLEWYVLGNDTGVNGGKDNTIIFATTSIMKNMKFSESLNNKNYSYKANTGYGSSDGNTEVFANHYGASDIRKALNSISADTDYFTSTEQSLMNSTTISTPDEKSVREFDKDGIPIYDIYYINNDKLYLPFITDKDSRIIRVSSNNQLELPDAYYWNDEVFWLRKGILDDDKTYHTYPDFDLIMTSLVNTELAVRPAANINLTNVLFASVAKANESGTIADGAAMTLRLDGKGKNIGEVYYDNATNKIRASKGNTESKVSLIVQGKDGTQNWYYSKEINGTESINTSDIKKALGLSSDISLTDSKIWLEITDDDGMIYAVQAKAAQEINSVEVKIDAPEAGQDLATEVLDITEGVNVDSISWNPNDTVSGYYKQYTITLTLSPKSGYRFTDNITLKLNNKDLSSLSKNTDGTITVEYTFDKTAKDVLDSIDNPEFIYENGTPKEEFIFPDTVAITTKGNSSLSVPVTWDKDVLNTYNPLNPDEVMIKLSGTASIPEYIDYSSNKVIMTVTVERKIRMINGDKQTANINEGLPAVFKSNAEFKDFVRVEVDDKIIVKDQDYEVREGSIIVTLKPEYLSKLSLGEHKIAIISYKDKNHEEVYEVKAEGTFTIISNKAESGNNGSHTVIIPDTSVK